MSERRSFPFPLSVILLAAAVAGCAPEADPPTITPPCERCALADANNFTWSSDLQVDEWRLASGMDATIRWGELDHDMYGDPLDPLVDVTRVALLAFPGLAPTEVAAALAADTLLQSNVGLFVFCAPTSATCRLSDFELFGNGLAVEQYFIEGTGTWLAALLSAEDTIGAVAFLLPDAGSTATEVDVRTGTSTLALDVDLRSLTPVVVPTGAPFQVDWSGLTRDGLGHDLALGTLDRLVVGRFDRPIDEIEGRVHDLVGTADGLWSLDVAGTEADLSLLVGDTPFSGIDAEATWLLALYCTSCLNPAPRFATVLTAATEAED